MAAGHQGRGAAWGAGAGPGAGIWTGTGAGAAVPSHRETGQARVPRAPAPGPGSRDGAGGGGWPGSGDLEGNAFAFPSKAAGVPRTHTWAPPPREPGANPAGPVSSSKQRWFRELVWGILPWGACVRGGGLGSRRPKELGPRPGSLYVVPTVCPALGKRCTEAARRSLAAGPGAVTRVQHEDTEADRRHAASECGDPDSNSGLPASRPCALSALPPKCFCRL
ncbi:fibroin heavy chain-like [Dromiciops gliroides]|uniref:fibroin heavy chain-like n=1 Tax=Dromiciops gliroides TaxID=33562 RepID=UPI001CC577ED|nr:fibroin heavy chain-like [Dromiciops gliroides]XP_043828618.1 fibroin heavy chain-like [Dromiciops gliroides]